MVYTRHLLSAAAIVGLTIITVSFLRTPSLSQTLEPLSSALRGMVPIDKEGPPPHMTPQINTAEREVRNYPEQPPLIPHSIDAYQLDLNINKCLSCHARSRTGESRAPMLSITHFMNRDGQFLATVSPRRYFCTQCHVPQHPVKPPVANTFIDVDTVLRSLLEKTDK